MNWRIGFDDNVNVMTRKRENDSDVPTLKCLHPTCNVHHDKICGFSEGKQQGYTEDKWMMCRLQTNSIQHDDIRKQDHYSATNIRQRKTASLTCG